MTSLKDISVVCGVSIATVSKALNDHKDIGEETKAHIRQVARELGYSPNSAARALKTNRTYNIGVLFSHDDSSGLTHDFFTHVLNSFMSSIEQQGYDLTFINNIRDGVRRMSYLDHCRYRKFDGVAIICADFLDPEVEELAKSEIPVVTVDHVFNDRISVVSDNVKGMHDLITYIYTQGHRQIAYIHGLPSGVTKSRLSSFYRTTEELGLVIPDEYVMEGAYRDTGLAYRLTERLLDLKEPPTCIVYADDFAAFGGMNAIKDRGLRIPDDISVAGYDGLRLGQHLEPKLTTLAQDTDKMGRAAADRLIRLIEKPKSAFIEMVVVEGELMKGQSVGKIQVFPKVELSKI